MNALSWALYAADALGSLKVLLFVLAGIFGPAALIVTAIQREDASMSYSTSKPWPWPKGSVAAALMMTFVACALPSSRTVYMIAASEAGERIANSQDGRDMLDLIRRKIREALSEKA